MNSLLGGRMDVGTFASLFSDAKEQLQGILQNPHQKTNVAIQRELYQIQNRIKEKGTVARQDLAMLSSHFPDAMKDIPMQLFTMLPSRNGVELALEAFSDVLSTLQYSDARLALNHVVQGLSVEIGTLEELGSWYTGCLDAWEKESSDVVSEIGEINRENHITVVNNAFLDIIQADGERTNEQNTAVERFCQGQTGIVKHLALLGQDVSATNVVNYLNVSQIMFASLQAIANSQEPLKQLNVDAWEEAIRLATPEDWEHLPNHADLPFSPAAGTSNGAHYVDFVTALKERDDFTFPQGFLQGVRDFHEFTVPAIIRSMRDAQVIIVGRLNALVDLRAQFQSYEDLFTADEAPSPVLAQLSDKLNREALSVVSRAIYLQHVRVELLNLFIVQVGQVMNFAEATRLMLAEAVAFSEQRNPGASWDYSKEEIEAADGYTLEGASESFRMAMEMLMNLMKKLGAWIQNTWYKTKYDSTIDMGNANIKLMNEFSVQDLPKGSKDKIEHASTTGIANLSEYAGLGTIWGDTYKTIMNGLTTPVAGIQDLYQTALRDQPLDDEKVAKVRQSLADLFDKANFKRLPDIADDTTIDSIDERLNEQQAKIKAEFTEPASSLPGDGQLKTYNQNATQFLNGPGKNSRNGITGREMDNMVSKLNAMTRTADKDVNNKGLATVKSLVAQVRKLVTAAGKMLIICNSIESYCDSYIKVLNTRYSREQDKQSGDLKQEGYQPDELDMAIERLPNPFTEVESLLNVDAFEKTPQERYISYTTAMGNVLVGLQRGADRRVEIRDKIKDVGIGKIDDVDKWSEGLDVVVSNKGMGEWHDALADSLLAFCNDPSDIDKAFTALNIRVLADSLDANVDGDEDAPSVIARFQNTVFEDHRELTDSSDRCDALKAFVKGKAPFADDASNLSFTSVPEMPVIEDKTERRKYMEKLSNYAAMFCLIVGTLTVTEYGSDVLLMQDAGIANPE